jgi:hypothetical protein
VLIAVRMAEIISDLMDADGGAAVGEVVGERRDEMARLLALARLGKLDRAALNRDLQALDLNPESVSDGRKQ